MKRSFDLIDFKVAESEYFLKRISKSGHDIFGVRFNVSAFISATRTITYALQACLKECDKFLLWYEEKQRSLKKNKIAKFFHDFRNVNQHLGENPITHGHFKNGKNVYWFKPTNNIIWVPKIDVETSCRIYFISLLEIVYDCYILFGPQIDPKQYYTKEHFSQLSKSIEDAEEEAILEYMLSMYEALSLSQLKNKLKPIENMEKQKNIFRGWTKVNNIPEEYRWQLIRDMQPACRINYIFKEYLDKITPEPKRLPKLSIYNGKGKPLLEKGGWIYIPEEYRKSGDPEKDIINYLENL